MVRTSNGTPQTTFQRCCSDHPEQSSGTFVLVLHLQRTVSVWFENPNLSAGLQPLRTLVRQRILRYIEFTKLSNSLI